jgi:hypothetical protein
VAERPKQVDPFRMAIMNKNVNMLVNFALVLIISNAAAA